MQAVADRRLRAASDQPAKAAARARGQAVDEPRKIDVQVGNVDRRAGVHRRQSLFGGDQVMEGAVAFVHAVRKDVVERQHHPVV